MGKSRSSRSPSRKKSSRRRSRSRSRSKHSRKSRHRSVERKSSKYRHSDSSSESSASRYKSSSKYKSKHQRRRDSRSPSHHKRRYRKSSSSSSSNSSNRSSSSSRSSHSSSSSKLHKNKPSSSYVDKIRAMRTPTPPRITHTANLDFLYQRPVSDAIDEINADRFIPKTFNSSTDAKSTKDSDVLKVKGEPRIIKINAEDDPLFHKNVFGDNDERLERWVKKAFSYRQKMFGNSN